MITTKWECRKCEPCQKEAQCTIITKTEHLHGCNPEMLKCPFEYAGFEADFQYVGCEGHDPSYDYEEEGKQKKQANEDGQGN